MLSRSVTICTVRGRAALVVSCSLLVAGCGSKEYTPEERAGQLVRLYMEKDGVVPDSLECDGPDAGDGSPRFYTCRTTQKGSTKPIAWYVSCETVNTKKPLTRLRADDPGGAGDCYLD